jgi:regulator of sigma E protease
MEIVTKILEFLLSISILIVLHEMGHFLFARLFKTRVEKFYLFFNPWFSIFKIKRGETEYGLGWLPLGGYVKISGMIDESMDKEAMKQPPQPWEFRTKPAWQRLLIMLGGIIVNLILGYIIYSMVLFKWGDKYIPNSSLKDGVFVVDSLALNMGFKTGDKILRIDDVTIDRFSDIVPQMLFGKQAFVQRGDSTIGIPIPGDFVGQLVDKRSFLFYPRFPFFIGEVPDTSHNAGAGLLENDRIVSVNGVPLSYYDEFAVMADTLRDRSISLGVEREGKTIAIPVQVNANGKIGVMQKVLKIDDMMRYGIYDYETRSYGFFESFGAGFTLATEKLGFYIRQFGLLLDFKTGAYKGLGGFGTIGSLYSGEWIWEDFWSITAFLSLVLAFMNVLPIPALDGGHVMFLLYEMISGRKPGDKFLEYAQIVGMVIVFSLLILANGNDILRGCF